MTLLYLGLALFFIPHLLGVLGLKDGLKARLGETPFKGLYALASLAGIVIAVIGYQNAPYIPVDFYTAPGNKAVAHALMPFAVIFAAGANMKSNLKQFIPHPLAVATLLWAISHIVMRDDLASIVLFASFGLFALLNMTLTSAGPRPPTQPRSKDLILVVAGLVAYGAIGFVHGQVGPQVFG